MRSPEKLPRILHSQQVNSRVRPFKFGQSKPDNNEINNELELDEFHDLNVSKTPTKITPLEEAKKFLSECGLKTNGVSKTNIMRMFNEL